MAVEQVRKIGLCLPPPVMASLTALSAFVAELPDGVRLAIQLPSL
jgi:hypothetical protein